MKNVLSFLRDLCGNNNRDWFDKNRDRYQQAKNEFELFTNQIIADVQKLDPMLSDVTAKNSIFRIFRDARFSNDKTPYKINMGAFIVPGGRKSMNAGYYFHIEPDNSFIAGGIYMPPADKLLKIRQAIFDDPDSYKTIIQEPEFVKAFGEVDGERLKANPRGFPKDFKDMELLKLKSYNVITKLSDKAVLDSNLKQVILDNFKIMVGFNTYLNKVLL